MTFRSPWMLLLLVVVPAMVAAYVSARRRRARRIAELAAQGLVATSPASRLGRRRHVPFGLFTVALTLLLIGVARPMTT
ncbi:MAG TPA: BatA domain-containing protein, partial [Acidimicrobiales bacterium]|nr:BatA domain-containing protein [Acidimicrobiales bacterium]